jgi:hypothetical protein
MSECPLVFQHAQRLAQDLEPMTAKLGEFIQEENAVVSSRHVARHREVPAAD